MDTRLLTRLLASSTQESPPTSQLGFSAPVAPLTLAQPRTPNWGDDYGGQVGLLPTIP